MLDIKAYQRQWYQDHKLTQDKRSASWSKTHPKSRARTMRRYKKKVPEMNVFLNMTRRCRNPRAMGYQNYGGRGIKVLYRSFAEFIADVGPRPIGMTIDRINNDGNYERGNCRWATMSQQAFNRRAKCLLRK